MVIQGIPIIKTAVIDAGSYEGTVCQGKAGYGGAVPEGFFHAYRKWFIVRFGAEHDSVASKVDDGILDAVGKKIFFQSVGNIAFGEKSKVKGAFGIGQSDGRAGDHDVTIVNVCQSACDLCFIGKLRRFGRMEVPEGNYCFDRRIDLSVS